jgi:hypothetical protein
MLSQGFGNSLVLGSRGHGGDDPEKFRAQHPDDGV